MCSQKQQCTGNRLLPNPESLVSETVTEIEKLKGALGTRARVLAHALASTYMYRRRGLIIAPKDNGGKIETAGRSCACRTS